uniref:Uncharacterized protein n=1 Tax=Glossina pallidipes TaxID=7398 RepID=A0A1B0ABF2_GLOPL
MIRYLLQPVAIFQEHVFAKNFIFALIEIKASIGPAPPVWLTPPMPPPPGIRGLTVLALSSSSLATSPTAVGILTLTVGCGGNKVAGGGKSVGCAGKAGCGANVTGVGGVVGGEVVVISLTHLGFVYMGKAGVVGKYLGLEYMAVTGVVGMYLGFEYTGVACVEGAV